MTKWEKYWIHLPVADIGGRRRTPHSGFRPTADPKGPPLYYFEIYIFGKVPFAANIHQFLREERAPKKRDFLAKIFRKLPKNTFFGLFFQKFAGRAEKFGQNGGIYSDLGGLRKSIGST